MIQPRQNDVRVGGRLTPLLRIPVPWVFALSYVLGAVLHRLVPIRLAWLLPIDPSLVGAGLFTLGVLIAGWGWMTFHRAGTTRVPGERSTTLVTWGPYRFTRNPMYIGLSLAYLGEAGLLHQLWPVLLLPLTIAYVNGVVIPVEESRLHEVFGETYDAYRARVRRWL